ncbi:MAG TPA: hypothetical protein VKC34_06680, partial [Blastocatellia bacterium]|nr:hypothetical protein [Blastocatellia bacterium]
QDMTLVENFYIRLGDVQLDTGDAPGALQSYSLSREMTGRRARENPTDDANLGLAFGHSHVGEALGASGDVHGAIASYSEAARIVEELVRKHPSHPAYRAGLRIIYNWLGNFYGSPLFISLGDREAALLYFRRGLVLAEALAVEDPKNAVAQLNLATNCGLVADIVSDADPARAADYYRRAISITRTLLETAPGELRLLRKQSLFCRGFAALQERSGDCQGALEYLRQSLQMLQDWSALHSTNHQVEADLHATHNGLAGVLLGMGDREGAGEHCRLAMSIADAGVAAHPSDLHSLWRLADSYSALGKLHSSLASSEALPLTQKIERWRESRVWHQKALDVWNDWNRHTGSTAFNNTKRDHAARLIAQCNAALAALGSRPGR